jgi:hypothetical protein
VPRSDAKIGMNFAKNSSRGVSSEELSKSVLLQVSVKVHSSSSRVLLIFVSKHGLLVLTQLFPKHSWLPVR